MSTQPADILKQRAAVIKGKRPVDALGAVARSAKVITLRPPDAPAGTHNASRYTDAQVNEKPAFRFLLHELVKTLPPDEPGPKGRPRIPLGTAIYSCVYKSYIGLSGRRFMSDIRDAFERGYVSAAPSYNSISRWLCFEELTPVLRDLIQGVAMSFSHIERNFAVDSTAFRIPKITKWCDEKHGWRKRREWVKCHVMVGARTHIVTAVEVTKRRAGDSGQFGPLMDATAEGFRVDEVAADRAYSTVKCLEKADALGAFPAIPFKSNATGASESQDSIWRRMYHTFALNQFELQEKVNRQNQAESTFSMIKRKFGEKIFSKDETAQINEVLCKVLCHNLVVLIYWLYEFGIEEKFIEDREGEAVPAEPLPIEDADSRERHYSVVESLMRDNGLTREQAWAVARKLL